ncbi:4-hydroxy-tetrahydrodipicolinate reductase protein [Halorhabdus tiamatea SARL4B]|uniref:4-hydroxy-tetrahydrodipicolinate reductase n=1 Tax=Halorhabdus tiamatea SARL4B TaxID=1033806 RepID=S6CZT6_9EURY|nr:4-hydroxy-tetrahydrodipicolinate reductase [Halorhabdus tiamatea]ERJ05885.1 4-hydroxy-tetrahydrodipicolinate reductase protein [Halorhabdus tiamatea SARL4B]CCQ32978.1 dihydrodipicolinate reductase [Halorhabdus tiamatea SARL4B]
MRRIGVTGAAGRMGRTVIETAGDREDVAVVFAVDATDEEKVADKPIHEPDDVAALLATHEPDAIVDFSVPEATVAFADACAEAGVALVTGTTGFEDDQLDSLKSASEDVAVLKAANFARGIQALLATVRAAAGALPGYDVELTETHHNKKQDAPSGTAKTLLEALAEEREEDFEEVYGREGIDPREAGEIGVHVRRAGDVRGEHELMFAGNDEVLTLSHRAEDRGVFAAGALDAAVWLADRDPGLYTFGDVIEG